MDLLSPADMTIAAVVLPPVVALINQRHWSSAMKGVVALAACLAFAALATVLRGPFDWRDWRDAALQVCGLAFAAYKLWWQPSGIAPTIEALTTPGATKPVGLHRANG